jgi:predicted HD phosphohydrolase
LKPNLKIINTENIVDFIGSIFERRGGEEYLGEPVTMGQHMLQGATLAEQNEEPDEIVVGALLHDIGHFTSEFGTFSMDDTEDRYHENAGAALLENFFPSVITDCCRYHVAAKRYLCATDPKYFNKLSDASVHSLNLQGGPMSEAEIINFKRNPNLKQILTVRLYDDAAKVPKMATPSFRHFAPLVHKMLNNFVPANG